MEEINISDYEERDLSFKERAMWEILSKTLWPYRYQMTDAELFTMGRMHLRMSQPASKVRRIDVREIEAIEAKYLATEENKK